ncbi:16S rRNA (guanine(527)-N(7))-methyltransferase RsmG [Limimaricola pyoseonensis]|uniref:Ribosomal RNA small subunit methyltransferase G n=1 Tax=Limimaricola pyoseonensis TaxID=521013 RepID=A0A1G7EN03_9RHOB|nr:16S rRNA (guanine(527)-N(7))-methyltransferase RsmG [Limimaricola pyoseonensis]SDE65068.1 16S rRNA m(7)G-527 methyltransferase [Limimaricola pyoseonensis]
MSATSYPDVSRETAERLHRYAELVRKWNPSINLVAKRDLELLETRHIADSLQLAAFLPSRGHWVDLGSGGGFPGIVVAAAARDRSPELRFTLVESDARKAAFLATAIRELDLNAAILARRIEAVDPLGADIVSARALAPLDRLIALGLPHLAPGGRMIFPKGRRAEDEIRDARAQWKFDCVAHKSDTDPEARILEISRAEHG